MNVWDRINPPPWPERAVLDEHQQVVYGSDDSEPPQQWDTRPTLPLTVRVVLGALVLAFVLALAWSLS